MNIETAESETVLRRSTQFKLSRTRSTERDTRASSVDRTLETVPLAQAPSPSASLVPAGQALAGPRRCITSSNPTDAALGFSGNIQPSPAMLSELLKFFSLLDEIDRSAAVELERAA